MANTEDFETLLGQFERTHLDAKKGEPQVGDRVRGVIVSIESDRAYVSLGTKSEGVIETSELADADGQLTVSVGDAVQSVVTGKDETTGMLLLGSQHGRRMHGSSELEQAYENQLPVEGQVTGVTKGGIEIQIAGVRAFCPASQIDLHYVEDLDPFVGQKLAFRITKYQGGRHINLVVSRRALLEQEQQARAEQTRAQLEVGAVLSGTVTSLQDYGAFVDLGGVEGMIHISELAFSRVKHPSELLSVGQELEVAVLRIEKTDNPKHPEKIALSLRALARDPWQDVEQRFPVGARVKGSVTRLQPFGAFVALAEGIEGLVHISELGAGRRVSHPHEVVNSGDSVEATVLSVDTEKRRIGLSLDTTRHPGTEAAAEALTEYRSPPQSPGTLGDLLRESMDKQKGKKNKKG
jgi:small subunit ribosomal protein S1